ncbi:MAG TPA: hypothetical protein VLA93_11400 [Pyrinomonadaceae bacterium]|nr:hypothetical protein [Pyrinomonadaceae bacterium]
METERNQRRWGVVAVIAIALLGFVPQLWVILDRGREWNGSNAITHTDEVAYSAYISSLIRGRPRRNDPFTGRQDTADTRAPESLFSIQMVPAYGLAVPARMLGLSASTVFIVVPAICAIASALAILWLVSTVSGDRRVGAVAVCFVLGFGTLLARQGMIRYIPTRPFLIPQWISDMVQSPSLFHLPFLRFYQPAVGFPLFFVLCTVVWIALTSTSTRKSLIAATVAAGTFAILVFTYFFLWTAAAAWLICILALWLIARKEDRRRTLTIAAVIGVTAVPVLVGYFRLLSHRASTVDAAQALIATHRPDLFRLPELVAVVSLIWLLIGLGRRFFAWRDPHVLLVASLAFSVIAVFNQQILTGRSLQPFHYEWFIANYCAGLALLLAVNLVGRQWWTNRRFIVIACIAILWAIGEIWLATTLNRPHNDHIDDGRIVARRLAELSSGDGTLQAEKASADFPVVLVSDLELADRLPTDAPQVPLWAPHMLIFPGVTEAENRERFFKQLYYLGFNEKTIYNEIDRSDWTFYAGLFPYYRLSPVTRGNASPITPEEIRTRVKEYTSYSAAFSREQATYPRLQYLVTSADREPSYENIDRWYERDRGEILGKFVLYRLKVR